MRIIFTNSKGQFIDFCNIPNVALYNVEGLAPTELIKGTIKKAYSNGVIVNSTSRGERQIILNLALEGGHLNDAIRRNLYEILGDKDAGELRYIDEELDVFTEAYAEAPQVETWTLEPTIQVAFLCPSAFFKDTQETVLNLSQVNPRLQFPLEIKEDENGVIMGEEPPAANEFVLLNKGQVSTGVKIVCNFTQEVKGVKFINESNGQILTVDYTFKQGDILTITTEIGEKGAILYRDGTLTDIFSAINYGEEWLRIERGKNIIRYSYLEGDGTAGIFAKISFNALYWGV